SCDDTVPQRGRVPDSGSRCCSSEQTATLHLAFDGRQDLGVREFPLEELRCVKHVITDELSPAVDAVALDMKFGPVHQGAPGRAATLLEKAGDIDGGFGSTGRFQSPSQVVAGVGWRPARVMRVDEGESQRSPRLETGPHLTHEIVHLFPGDMSEHGIGHDEVKLYP